MRRRGYEWLAALKGHRVGPYVLDDFVGAGNIGYVYKAHLSAIIEIEHAVKLVPSPKPGWENELKKVARLSKIANVVHFHTISTDQVTTGEHTAVVQYTAWDYVSPGRNLRKYVNSMSACPVTLLYAVVTTVLRVLHACSQLGISRHGDLHAGNVLIGEQDNTQLDASLNVIEPIYVSDFGYGTSGGRKAPKDDYDGLAQIADTIIEKVDWVSATASDKVLLSGCRDLLKKLSHERTASEKYTPLDALRTFQDIHNRSRRLSTTIARQPFSMPPAQRQPEATVGQYQISEMLGDDWELWKALFVPRVPARSRILERDITAVVTGPRGCGKTMLFRRLSERLILECGPVDDTPSGFAGLYVNANDISDAFSTFPEYPSEDQWRNLYCFAHLSILSEALAVQAVAARDDNVTHDGILKSLRSWFGDKPTGTALVSNEDALGRYRNHIEQIKRLFVRPKASVNFPAAAEFSHHSFLKQLIPTLREHCAWIGDRMVFVLFDDYTTPRLSNSMQRFLNRLIFQRSNEFVFKVATEAATTFVAEDSSGKLLQDGDDYRLVDMGEESLFMSDEEKEGFLNAVFARRMARDPRLSERVRSLPSLLGRLGISKTAFARLLRSESNLDIAPPVQVQLRGAAKKKVLYSGHDVFTGLWSGDTRLMIQLLQDVVDAEVSQSEKDVVDTAVSPETQDRVFRNRGGQWLDQQRRNHPTDIREVDELLRRYQEVSTTYRLAGGSFGTHLKAIVEAFKAAARAELLGPTYKISEGARVREVPKMAFRIEITDEFRLDDLAAAIYRDLIRYGLFMRDARGKSIRGAMVPRLYLRRLLLPYCVLPLSKRDSVSMTCEWFTRLLLDPDGFTNAWNAQRSSHAVASRDQMAIFAEPNQGGEASDDPDPLYDDLGEDDV